MRKINETQITAILGVNQLLDVNQLWSDDLSNDLRTYSDQRYQMRQKMRFIALCS